MAEKPINLLLACDEIKIAGVEKEALIKDGSKEIDSTLSLPSGITELWTYIYNQQGQVGGAYFTEVEKL